MRALGAPVQGASDYGMRGLARESAVARASDRLQLLGGGLGAAVPGLGEMRHGIAEMPGECRCAAPERSVGEAPDALERDRARHTVTLARLDLRLNVRMQRVDARVGVRPGVAEARRIEVEA